MNSISARVKQTIVCIFFCAFLAACGGDVEPPVKQVKPPEVVDVTPIEPQVQKNIEPEIVTRQIALLLPLSGSEQAIGTALFDAATLAFFDAYNPDMELVPYDTKGTAIGTDAAITAAIDGGADVILGPLLSENVRRAGPVAAQADIPLIGFTSDSAAATPDYLIMGFLPEAEVKRIIDFAAGQGKSTYSALIPDSAYGDTISRAFGDSVGDAGGTVEMIESYPRSAEAVFEPVRRLADYAARTKARRDEVRFLKSLNDDMTDEIAAKLEEREVLEDLNVDAILVPEGGELLRTLAPLLPYYEVDPAKVKFLGTGLWFDSGLKDEPPLHGAWFAAPDPDSATAFLDRFEETYSRPAPRIATLAYDAVALIAAILREKQPADQILLGDFQGIDGFYGIDGLFRFLPSGRAERALSVLEITENGFNILDPAPKSFPSFGFPVKQTALEE